jgi:hypothetical protein
MSGEVVSDDVAAGHPGCSGAPLWESCGLGVQGSSRMVSSISAARPAAKDTSVPIGWKPAF